MVNTRESEPFFGGAFLRAYLLACHVEWGCYREASGALYLRATSAGWAVESEREAAVTPGMVLAFLDLVREQVAA